MMVNYRNITSDSLINDVRMSKDKFLKESPTYSATIRNRDNYIRAVDALVEYITAFKKEHQRIEEDSNISVKFFLRYF